MWSSQELPSVYKPGQDNTNSAFQTYSYNRGYPYPDSNCTNMGHWDNSQIRREEDHSSRLTATIRDNPPSSIFNNENAAIFPSSNTPIKPTSSRGPKLYSIDSREVEFGGNPSYTDNVSSGLTSRGSQSIGNSFMARTPSSIKTPMGIPSFPIPSGEEGYTESHLVDTSATEVSSEPLYGRHYSNTISSLDLDMGNKNSLYSRRSSVDSMRPYSSVSNYSYGASDSSIYSSRRGSSSSDVQSEYRYYSSPYGFEQGPVRPLFNRGGNPIPPPGSASISNTSTGIYKGTVNYPISSTIRGESTPPLLSRLSAHTSGSPSISQSSNREKDTGSEKESITSTKKTELPQSVARDSDILLSDDTYYGFNQYRGRVMELVCTQNGSKALQNYLSNVTNPAIKDRIVTMIAEEIGKDGYRVICDTFGNYFFQLLFKEASNTTKEYLLRKLLFCDSTPLKTSVIYDISINRTGTFALQNIIDYMGEDMVLGDILNEALNCKTKRKNNDNHILLLIKDNKGTHIIQRIMKTFPPEQWQHIYAVLLSNCYSVAKDRNGSMVLRLCYDLVGMSQKQPITKIIIEHAAELATDPVGNYVVQHILSIPENASEEDRKCYHSFVREVLSCLSTHYVELSKQKYSSNVVEKSIHLSVLLGDDALLNELLTSDAILQLLDSHFGTYVLQKALQAVGRTGVKKIDDMIRKHHSFSNNYNLLNKWKQVYSKASV